MTAIPCAIVRGGTSKGVFMLDKHLPADPEQRDRVLLQLMGSPDPRQIDGLGGADPLSSKVAIVAPSMRAGFDVEYESLEIGIAEAHVNHGLMCGNLIAGVGHFALAEGLVKAQSPVTTVKIYCRSNQKMIVAKIPLSSSAAMSSGLPDRNAMVSLLFNNPGGAVTGRLLPAGEALSLFSLDHYRDIAVSIVDAGTLYAFVRADALGLAGSESVAALDSDTHFRASIELLRSKVADYINQHSPDGERAITPRLVKVAIIGSPVPGQHNADVVARVVNTAKVHKAYAVSGGICLAAAAAIPGSVVNQIVRPAESPFNLRISHPSGTLSLRTYWASGIHGIVIHATEIERSARIILRGTAYVTASAAAGHAEHVDAHTPCLEAVL